VSQASKSHPVSPQRSAYGRNCQRMELMFFFAIVIPSYIFGIAAIICLALNSLAFWPLTTASLSFAGLAVRLSSNFRRFRRRGKDEKDATSS
jgi:membrane protein implicated in regulation of membrane protease activity